MLLSVAGYERTVLENKLRRLTYSRPVKALLELFLAKFKQK